MPGDWVCQARLESRAQVAMSAHKTALCEERKTLQYFKTVQALLLV